MIVAFKSGNMVTIREYNSGVSVTQIKSQNPNSEIKFVRLRDLSRFYYQLLKQNFIIQEV